METERLAYVFINVGIEARIIDGIAVSFCPHVCDGSLQEMSPFAHQFLRSCSHISTTTWTATTIKKRVEWVCLLECP